MDILQAIKELRILSDIPQAKMVRGMSRSSYSKIEKGDTDLKYKVLQQICTRLGVTVHELLMYAAEDTNIIYRRKLNACISNRYDSKKKIDLLNHFYCSDKGIKDMSVDELKYYSGIKCLFGGVWNEVSKYSENDIKEISNVLSQQHFYVQGHYQILMNSIIFMNATQIDILLNKMYPINKLTQRTDLLINFSARALINLITQYIYTMEYREALKIVEFAEKNITYNNDYFLALSLDYHKNIILRYINRDTLYIQKARDIISIFRSIKADDIADEYERELNNLTEQADYYFDEAVANYAITKIE